MRKLSLLIGLLCALWQLCAAQEESPCANNCMLRFRCSPYYKDYVWSIVDNRCRVFQNGCIFANENCSRVNSCQKEMVATTQQKCLTYCNAVCSNIDQPICAGFPITDSNGNSDIQYRTFKNRCILDRHACKTAHAFLGEPSAGACP